MLKGLIFDLDGVITDSAVYHLKAWQDLAKSIGIDLPEEFGDKLRGRSRMDSLELILEFGHKQDQYTEAEKEALAAKKNAAYVNAVKQMTRADILPNMDKLLAEAKQQGLKLALASASKNAPLILHQLGLEDAFEARVDPATLKHGKPDPEIYVKAQELLGLKADEVISFEDAPAGIQSIKAAGQFAVGIGDPVVLKGADYVVGSTSALELSKIEKVFEKTEK
ncbi:beta-phosphoglucomutase [Lactobacillus porci]|uniref:beta-phosphoglucomutase n=1 Tax=Lactobacillus porci TaxID=2012477 RepID=UPI002A2B7F0C|nr:beta-phosphoglucomutase [Lactobacillus porci]